MDYCTLFPEGWWAQCCQIHDNDYAQQIGQALADERLQACVASAVPVWAADHPGLAAAAAVASFVIGRVMWLGVRVFGRRYYKDAGKEKGGAENGGLP